MKRIPLLGLRPCVLAGKSSYFVAIAETAIEHQRRRRVRDCRRRTATVRIGAKPKACASSLGVISAADRATAASKPSQASLARNEFDLPDARRERPSSIVPLVMRSSSFTGSTPFRLFFAFRAWPRSTLCRAEPSLRAFKSHASAARGSDAATESCATLSGDNSRRLHGSE